MVQAIFPVKSELMTSVMRVESPPQDFIRVTRGVMDLLALTGKCKAIRRWSLFRESCAKSAFDRGPTLDRAFWRESRIIIVEKTMMQGVYREDTCWADQILIGRLSHFRESCAKYTFDKGLTLDRAWWAELRTSELSKQVRTGGMQGNPWMKAGLSCNYYCFSLE